RRDRHKDLQHASARSGSARRTVSNLARPARAAAAVRNDPHQRQYDSPSAVFLQYRWLAAELADDRYSRQSAGELWSRCGVRLAHARCCARRRPVAATFPALGGIALRIQFEVWL